MNPVAGIVFACLVCSGLYINKYVLSVLGFKSPTIFQGWQTLTGLIIYKLLTYCSKTNFKLVGIDRPAFISLLPGFLFFTTSLVAASKALAGWLNGISSTKLLIPPCDRCSCPNICERLQHPPSLHLHH